MNDDIDRHENVLGSLVYFWQSKTQTQSKCTKRVQLSEDETTVERLSICRHWLHWSLSYAHNTFCKECYKIKIKYTNHKEFACLH